MADVVGNSIWLLDPAMNWSRLTPSFSAYFRIMLVHLGLPDFQLFYTSEYGPRASSLVSSTLSSVLFLLYCFIFCSRYGIGCLSQEYYNPSMVMAKFNRIPTETKQIPSSTILVWIGLLHLTGIKHLKRSYCPQIKGKAMKIAISITG